MSNVVQVTLTDELVRIRKVRKHAKRYTMGTVMLKNVTVNADSLTGEWLAEFDEIRELGSEVLKHLTELVYEPDFGFGVVTVTDDGDDDIVSFEPVTGQTYKAAYVCGTEVYVSQA